MELFNLTFTWLLAIVVFATASPGEFGSDKRTFLEARRGRIRNGGGLGTTTCRAMCKSPKDLRDLRDGRIIAGHRAPPGRIPWQASIEVVNLTGPGSLDHWCGGVLIGPRHVLTAAHCLIHEPTQYRVVLGIDDRGVGRRYVIEDFVSHRGLGAEYENDIALITLAEAAQCSSTVRPICLEGPTEVEAGKHCLISGWGRTEAGDHVSSHLLYSYVPVQSSETCNRIYNRNGEGNLLSRGERALVRSHSFTSNMLCAGSTHGRLSADICTGDSGGPLVCEHGGQSYLAGITSWSGFACGSNPSVYTKVAKYLSWIKQEQQLSLSRSDFS